MSELDRSKLDNVRTKLLELAKEEKLIWPWLSDTGGKPVNKKRANKYIFLCILDYQTKSDVLVEKVKRFIEEFLGDPEELWKEIFKKYPTIEVWNAKKKEFNLHHLSQAHERIWKIGKSILEYYDGDVRKAWINKSSKEVFECFKNKLKIGEQLSRMVVGGLNDSEQISGKGDLKADIHVRKVLGRIFYDNYKKETLSEDEATELARQIYPENPWDLDKPLYLTGSYSCKAKEPFCDNCDMTFFCDYFISERKGTTSVFWCNKGLALYKKEDYEEAIKCYDKALKINPKDIAPWFDRGVCFFSINNYEEALKCYDKVLKLNPEYTDVWFRKGECLLSMNNYEEALKCYNKAVELDPCDAIGWINKGSCLYGMEKYEEAIKYYDKGLELDPKHTIALWSKGNALAFGLGDYEEAIKCYDKALKINPNDIEALRGKESALCSLEKDEAKECYNKAITLDPGNSSILINRDNAIKASDKKSDSKVWVNFLTESINSIYKCNAVNNIVIGQRGDKYYNWVVKLKMGNDTVLIKPHLQKFITHIRALQYKTGRKVPESLTVTSPRKQDIIVYYKGYKVDKCKNT